LIFLNFIFKKNAMGLSAAIVVMTPAAIFAIAIAKVGFQRGDSFVSGAVVFVIFMVIVFIFYPDSKICYHVIINHDGDFVPLQFFRLSLRRLWLACHVSFSLAGPESPMTFYSG